MNISQQFITINRPFRKLVQLKGIIIHWTANVGSKADAQAHYRYFSKNKVNASAHYFVDDHEVVQLIPDDEVAWHIGDKQRFDNLPYRNALVPKGQNPNDFFIGIEMCVYKEANQQKVLENTIELVKNLLSKHKLTTDQVYRHYDMTGKDCPKMFLPTIVSGVQLEHAWLAFKEKLKDQATFITPTATYSTETKEVIAKQTISEPKIMQPIQVPVKTKKSLWSIIWAFILRM